MNDELTPEEKEALAKLPRERMPVGLEGRVVDAMRDHGFLAKRRRSIVLTNTRVAGVLAAGVALVIGAYSVGLHRGEEAAFIPAAVTEQPFDAERLAEVDKIGVRPPTLDAPKSEPDRQQATSELSKEAQTQRSRTNEATPSTESELTRVESPPLATRADEAKKDTDKQAKSKEEDMAAATESPASNVDADTPELARSAKGVSGDALAPHAFAPQPSASLSEAVQRPLTFHLGGKTVVIESPGNVRVVEDEPGKIILIYTSDGLIRIRVTD